MDEPPLILPWPLDRPLPTELTGTGHTWLTRYRRWPVFSPGWVRGRIRAMGILFGLLALPVVVTVLVAAPEERPLGGLVQMAVNVFLPLLAGPWLAGLVRRREWPLRAETAAIVAVIALVVALQLGFNRFGAEPLKQAVAEATGQVDEAGQRRRAALTIGISGGTDESQLAERALGGQPGDPPRARMPQWVNTVAAAVVTFFLAGGAGLRRRRQEIDALTRLARERELERARAERHEAELRLSVLAAQVEPHFLFNTLAGVRSAIATDPPRAAELIDRLVEYLRAAIPRLRSDGGAATTLGSQIEVVRAYLALMRTRMPRLSFEIDVAPELAALHFPPLMLVSLAENAVKHGIEPKVGPARIRVHAERDAQGRLAVTVADDGVGFGGAGGQTAGTGLGLSNLRERLQQLYRGEAALTLKARPDGGVAATIAIPAESNGT